MGFTVYYEARWRAKLTEASCRALAVHARAVNAQLSKGSEPYRAAAQPGDKELSCFTKLCGADPSRDFRTILAALKELSSLVGKARVVVSDDHYLSDADPNDVDPERVEQDRDDEPPAHDEQEALRLLERLTVPEKALALPKEPATLAAYAKLLVPAAVAASDLGAQSLPGYVSAKAIMNADGQLYERHRGWKKKVPSDDAELRDCVRLLCALERAGREFAVKSREDSLEELHLPSLTGLVRASTALDAFRAKHGIVKPSRTRR
jgi:hypothetical protein